MFNEFLLAFIPIFFAMDAIGHLDWGIYYHFAARQSPQLVLVLQPAHYIGSYVVVGALFALTFAWFLIQKKIRPAMIVLASVLAACGTIEATQYLVPRHRPHDAQNWLGAAATVGSYPSPSVFLFTLAMIVMGLALWMSQPRWWIRGVYLVIATLLTVWVAVSQFFLPLHFFSDALGGLAGAASIGWIAFLFMQVGSTPNELPVDSQPTVPSNAIQDLSRVQGIQK